MKFIYIKRGVHWVAELLITLLIFWIKNPKEAPAILRFIFKKIIAFPKFFSRNILTEKHSKNFKEKLDIISQLYDKLEHSSDPNKQNSHTQLKHLSKFEILYFLVRKLKPQVVAETGVAAGESTGYILQALKDNDIGKLYSIDLPFQWYVYGDNHTLHLDSLPAGKHPGYLIPEHLKRNWELILGDTHDKLPKLLNKLGKLDIFFHDSEHTEKTMIFEYESCWPYIKKGGYLISDDIDYTKAFSKFSKKVRGKIFKFKNLGIIKKQ